VGKQECFRLPGMGNRPFSSSVRVAGFVFASGTSGTQDENGNPVDSIQGQTRQCIVNMRRELALAHASLQDVVKVQVFLAKAEDWPLMNDVYREFFPENQPARTAVVVGFVRPEMLVEMECIAYVPDQAAAGARS